MLSKFCNSKVQTLNFLSESLDKGMEKTRIYLYFLTIFFNLACQSSVYSENDCRKDFMINQSVALACLHRYTKDTVVRLRPTIL
jgi:hypothetical protein